MKEGRIDSDSPWLTIVGVAGDVRHRGLDVEQHARLYLPFRQGMTWLMSDGQPVSTSQTIVLSASIDPSVVMVAARDVVRSVDPDLPIVELNTLDGLISQSVAGPRFRTILIGSLATLALSLIHI